jgi:hypothetical protein
VGRRYLWYFAKTLEGVGMVLVLVGVFWSMSLGLEDEGLKSMAMEMKGLIIGGGMFCAGWLLERAVGAR